MTFDQTKPKQDLMRIQLTKQQLACRVADCLDPELAQAYEAGYRQIRSAALGEPVGSAKTEFEQVRFTSQNVEFEVEPD